MCLFQIYVSSYSVIYMPLLVVKCISLNQVVNFDEIIVKMFLFGIWCGSEIDFILSHFVISKPKPDHSQKEEQLALRCMKHTTADIICKKCYR